MVPFGSASCFPATQRSCASGRHAADRDVHLGDFVGAVVPDAGALEDHVADRHVVLWVSRALRSQDSPTLGLMTTTRRQFWLKSLMEEWKIE